MVYGDPYSIEKEGQYRRQEAEQAAQQWRLAKLARRRSPARLQGRTRLFDLANTTIHRVRQWLSVPSEPQEQGC